MNKPVKYWIRRAIVSLPLWLLLVHEADTRTRDNGDRVFDEHVGMILWTVVFVLAWSVIDYHVSQRETRRKA